MNKELTQEEINNFSYGIVRVKALSFSCTESRFINDPLKEIKIEMSQLFGTNLEKELLDLRLRTYLYYPDKPNEILTEISVQNVFAIPNFKKYYFDNVFILPTQFLISIVSISISHSRALFCQNVSGTVYQDVIIPIVNPIN